jgi:hypothetical protein
MNTIMKMVLVMLAINVLMWLSQNAISEINPDANKFINVSTSPIHSYMDSQNQFSATSDILPNSTGVTQQNSYLNMFGIGTLTGWFSGFLSSFSFIANFVQAPYVFLRSLGVPIDLATAFAILWYVPALIALIAFIFGRND